MRAEDVTDTLDMALAASGCDQAQVHHRPRLSMGTEVSSNVGIQFSLVGG